MTHCGAPTWSQKQSGNNFRDLEKRSKFVCFRISHFFGSYLSFKVIEIQIVKSDKKIILILFCIADDGEMWALKTKCLGLGDEPKEDNPALSPLLRLNGWGTEERVFKQNVKTSIYFSFPDASFLNWSVKYVEAAECDWISENDTPCRGIKPCVLGNANIWCYKICLRRKTKEMRAMCNI